MAELIPLDPIFISLLTDILSTLAGSKAQGIYETVVDQALPVLTNAIVASAGEPWITGAAIDLASSLAQGAPESGLGDGFVNMLAPCLFLVLRTAEDRDVIQVLVPLPIGSVVRLTSSVERYSVLDHHHPQRLPAATGMV